MKYFKLIAFVISFVVITSTSWAMDGLEETPIKASLHTIPNMNDLTKFLGKESSPETVQKRAKRDPGNEEGDLSKTMIVFDFDEALAYLTTTALGSDFARDCRLFSHEKYREDSIAFSTAVNILNMSLEDFKKREGRWKTVHLCGTVKYALIEPSTKDLLTSLRKRGATLLVCSGNKNDERRSSFLKSLGFQGTNDYFYEPEDKTKPVKDFLKKKEFSTVLFVDNYKENAESFVQKLRGTLAQGQSQIKEITGLHYNYFHRTLDANLLASQYRQIEEYVEEKASNLKEMIRLMDEESVRLDAQGL